MLLGTTEAINTRTGLSRTSSSLYIASMSSVPFRTLPLYSDFSILDHRINIRNIASLTPGLIPLSNIAVAVTVEIVSLAATKDVDGTVYVVGAEGDVTGFGDLHCCSLGFVRLEIRILVYMPGRQIEIKTVQFKENLIGKKIANKIY